MNQEDSLKLKKFKSTLEETIINSEQVFVVTHINPDLDAIASAMGIYYIVKMKLKKNCYIIVNDNNNLLESGVKKIIEQEKHRIPFITLKKYLELKSENDILITTDVNKTDRISLAEVLDNFKDIVLIDHHGENNMTINTDKKFITLGVSSASEIVTKLFCEFRMNIEEKLATYLLAGIKLDSESLSKNTDGDTMDMIKKLYKNGANNDDVRVLFQENYESDVRIGELIKQLNFYIFQYAIAIGNDDETYTREELAKAADKALKYGVDCAFVAGYIDEDKTLAAVSARSNGKINVGKIMEDLKGGGNITSAATVSKELSTHELGEQLTLKLTNPYFKTGNNID